MASESPTPSGSYEWTSGSGEPADPAKAMLARVDSRATIAFDREIKRLREKGHRITLLNEKQFWALAQRKRTSPS